MSQTPKPNILDKAGSGKRVSRPMSRGMILALQALVVVAVIIAMFALNAAAGKLVMPKPTDIWTQSVKLWSDGTMLKALGESVTIMAAGFVISAVSGILLGVLLGGNRTLSRIFDPFVNALNSTPGAAFIPLIIVWFGLYTEAKIVVVWNAALFPILINTAAGIANANKDLVEMGRAFGANKATLFWRVMVPDALPSILSGLRIGAAISTVGTVIAELTMAQSGLGGLLAQAGNRFQMDRYFAVVIVLMALGTALTGALRYAERRLGRWRVAQGEGV